MTARLTFACGVYDRTLPLLTGEVRVAGVDLIYVPVEDPRAIFDRMARSQEFDLAEMSLSEVICRYVAGDTSFVALPVFPSRIFRHSMIAVNRRTVTSPLDLAGKRIGVPLYTMTAAVYIRGLLEHDYGVDLSGVHWVQGSINHATSHGNPAVMPLLRPVDILQNGSGRSLSDLIDAGELDAIVGTDMPEAMLTNPDIVRLFPDFRTVEQDYYRRTQIFPIMHTVAVRRAVYESEPTLGARLYAAFGEAKECAWERIRKVGTLAYMLPWMIDDVDEIDRVFGGDPWPYGVEPNRPTLDALMTYLVEQGLIAHAVPIEDLFAPVD